MAASFPLYTTQMFNNMGFQYAGLLMSLLIAIAIPLPFILIMKGETIRRRSPYASAQTGAGGEMSGPVMGARRAKIDRKNDTARPSFEEKSAAPAADSADTSIGENDVEVGRDA